MKLKVTGQTIEIVDPKLYVSDTENVYEVEYEFSDEWNGYSKTAVFHDQFGHDIDVVLTENKCAVPNEVIAESGHIKFGVYGVKVEGATTKRYPTVFSKEKWVDVGCKEGTSPLPPTPDVYAQILDAYTETNSRMDDYEEQLEAKYEKPEDGIPESDLAAEVQEKLNSRSSHPYTSLRRLATYLYEITFEDIPAIADAEITPSACTSFVKNGQLHRNLDWYYDESPSFKVIGKGFEGNAIDGRLLITEEFDDNVLGQLPYHIVDGKNDNGIRMSVHVLYNDWEWSADGEIPLTALPFYVLQNVKSMATIQSDLASVLSNLKASGQGDYLIQLLVTDGTTTYVIVPPESASGSYVLINATANPKLTNFRWVADGTVERTALQNRPTGVERWNAIESSTLSDLRFTKAYEAPTRLSEFIGLGGTTKDSTDAELEDIYDIAHAKYFIRTRNGQTWQTVHSVVYSANGIEHFWIQEDWDKDFCSSAVDAYTKAETDALLETKADSDDVYGRDYLDAKFAEKADADAVYGKDEVNELLDEKQDVVTEDTELTLKKVHFGQMYVDETTLQQTAESISDLETKKHTHSNKSILDTITQAMLDLIGTISGKYVKPTSGIPKTDLASSVQTSLGLADTALQEHQDISHLQTKMDNSLSSLDSQGRVVQSILAVDDKLDNSVVTGSTVDADDTSATLTEAKKNLESGATASTEIPLPIANDEQVGFMTPEQVTALAGALVAIGVLQGQTARLLYTAKTDPTASEILAFVQAQGYPPEKYSAIAVVIKDTNHIWKYETNNNAFRDYGLDTITQATQELLGIVKGATANGKIFVEADGSMSLNGYDAITTALTNLATALEGKVGFTDYATTSRAGVVKGAEVRGLIFENGDPKGVEVTKSEYDGRSRFLIIAKGTLENVLTGKNINNVANETWTFKLSNGTTVTKSMKVGS